MPAKRPTTPAPAYFAGVRVHYPGAVPGRCVGRFVIAAIVFGSAGFALAQKPAEDEPWRRAQPGYEFRFPDDHRSHPDYKIEWWYYTGNLKADDGRRFG